MGRFTELTEYKNKILYSLITDENIVKAVGNNESNFLDVSAISDAKTLLFTNIYPCSFIPETEELQKTYITIRFKYKKEQRRFKIGKIRFDIFTHRDLMQTDYSSIRTDYILNQIDELFNQTTDFGIGQLQFCDMGDTVVSTAHYGCFIEYDVMSYDKNR